MEAVVGFQGSAISHGKQAQEGCKGLNPPACEAGLGLAA